MEMMSELKPAEAGTIPIDWENKQLGDVIIHCSSGATPRRNRPEFYKGNIRWITSGELNYNVITDTIEKISAEAVSETNLTIHPKGTFLMAITGLEAEGTRGACGIVGAPAATNQSCMAVFPIPEKLLVEYLFHYYVYFGKALALRYCQGTKQQSYTASLVRKLPICLPSKLSEQAAIATTLSDVDVFLISLDDLIVKKRELKQAAMQSLLEGKIRLPEFNGEWSVRKLGNVGRCLRGVTYQGDDDLSMHDTPLTKRLLRSNNIKNAVVNNHNIQFVNAKKVSAQQILVKDDILICMANGSKSLVGKAGLFNMTDGYEYTFGSFMGCFRCIPTEANSGFIFYLFQTGKYRNHINNLLAGSSINNLKPSSIESLEFLMPDLPEQAAITRILRDMDSELSSLEALRSKISNLKQGMMQELLTGKTRLI